MTFLTTRDDVPVVAQPPDDALRAACPCARTACECERLLYLRQHTLLACIAAGAVVVSALVIYVVKRTTESQLMETAEPPVEAPAQTTCRSCLPPRDTRRGARCS